MVFDLTSAVADYASAQVLRCISFCRSKHKHQTSGARTAAGIKMVTMKIKDLQNKLDNLDLKDLKQQALKVQH
eukprot:2138924-Heterocapsa_arctica.AAC.1